MALAGALLATTAVPAQPPDLTVQIRCRPDDAEAFLILPGGGESLLGSVNRPLTVKRSDLKGAERMTLVLRRANCLPRTLTTPLKPEALALSLQQWSQGVELTPAQKYLLFKVSPPGALVYAQQSGPQGFAEHPTNQAFSVDASQYYDEKNDALGGFRVDIGQLSSDSKTVGLFHGYQPLPVEVPSSIWNQTPVGARTAEGTEVQALVYPPDGSLEMKAAPGLGNLAARNVYWAQQHPILTGFLGLVLCLGAISIPTMVLPQLRKRREKADRNARWEEIMSHVDQSDRYLGKEMATGTQKWLTTKRLGAGGMAVVYLAVPLETLDEHEAVAIKVMNPEVANDAEFRQRFMREIEISSQLNHPNIVRLIDWGDKDGILFLVMEFIQGSTMRDVLPRGGYPLPEALNVIRGITAGLAHAHKVGVVHRDLKPDNIMLTKGHVKITDLGLAKRDESQNVTKTGDTFGTPAYMAPEQIAGGSQAPNPATDQYALGVMCYEILTGRRPFEEEDTMALIMKHLQATPPTIKERNEALPDSLDPVLHKMMAKDPSQRYRTVQQACAALEEALRGVATPS